MPEQPIRVYADTSVFGAVFEAQFADASRRFFAQAREGRFALVISALVQREIAGAPERVRELFMEMVPLAETAALTEAALALRQAYLRAGTVTERWADDALHVAVASCAGCDAIVSWNFRQLVHFGKIARYNEGTLAEGHRPIAIHSPAEVVDYEEEGL